MFIYIYICIYRNCQKLIHFYVIALTKGNKYLVSNFHKKLLKMILQPFDVYHFLNLNLSSKVSVLEDTAFSVFYDNTIPFIKMFIYIYRCCQKLNTFLCHCFK